MSLSVLLVPAAVVYLLLMTALLVYGINFYYLTFLALRRGGRSLAAPEPPAVWPRVTIQLPIYNELYVARRVIEAADQVDYPLDRLEIQVLDDSADETVTMVEQAVAQARAAGVTIHHIRRGQRDGYKAGALRDGLQSASGEFIAIFDADFIPNRNFLKRTIPHFQDERVAFVQARWDHANGNYSLLTALQALSIDAHFMIEQLSRSQGGYWFNFNGTAGVWRKAAIEDAGGWQAHTLTEDLDLSYRAFLKGWRAVYLHDLAVPGEVPLTFAAYRRQQHRWARGSLESALILIPQIWEGNFPLRMKLEATLHLTGYGVQLLLLAMCLIYPLVAILSNRISGFGSLFGVALVFNLTALAPTLFFAAAQHQLKRPWWKMFPTILFATAFGSGMMLNTLRAALEVMGEKGREFERTPKYGLTARGQPWRHSGYKLKLDKIIFAEIALGLFNLASCLLALQLHNWLIAVYAFVFAAGLLFDAGYTVTQSIYALQRS